MISFFSGIIKREMSLEYKEWEESSPSCPSSLMAEVLYEFSDNTRRLKQVLEETQQLFQEIQAQTTKLERQDSFNTLLLVEEESEVISVANKPLTIVILGHSIHSKAVIANKILQQNILPSFAYDTENKSCTREIVIRYGEVACSISLHPGDYTVVEGLDKDCKSEIHHLQQDIIINKTEETNGDVSDAILEVTLKKRILQNGCQIIISPTNQSTNEMTEMLKNYTENLLPVFIFTYKGNKFTNKEVEELTLLQQLSSLQPVLFVHVPPPGQESIDNDPPDGAPTEYNLKEANSLDSNSLNTNSNNQELKQGNIESVLTQLDSLGYTDFLERPKNLSANFFEVETCVVEDLNDFNHSLLQFSENMLKSYLANASSMLYNVHSRCLGTFIVSAFDMTRELLITPKKLAYAEKKENELYHELMQLAASKQNEITDVIQQTVSNLVQDIDTKMIDYQFVGVELTEEQELKTASDVKLCTSQIQNFVLKELNIGIADKLINSVNVLKELYTGTLTRTLEHLETCESEFTDGAKTTDALKQILNAAYQVEITFESSSTFMRLLLEKMKQLILSMPWNTPPRVDLAWKRKVAIDMLNNLCETRLAKNIASQIQARLNKSHSSFTAALKQLESKHCGRMDKIEAERIRVRKIHAPKVAKLALESSSLKDMVLYGVPRVGREIGRGQYGIVYSCDAWANNAPCAIKSVVPPDEKHWNDLAMELFYTKNIPDHERIVSLRGSVIDYLHCGGLSPAVLLVMDRLQRDLHSAIKQQIDWASRLQVAIDVIEGIRFLHSQGLVHRDIKMKNVLMDKKNRGKLTDLGFCKPEAMISGSIVGTPIHMAPELLTRQYDNTVDVYAFGILFWYLCSGDVQLPQAFDECYNKDHLWHSVKRGLRPERLKIFSKACWDIMTQCWHGDPSKRPLLGIVENKLREIQKTVLASVETVNTSKISSRNDVRNMKWFNHRRQNQC